MWRRLLLLTPVMCPSSERGESDSERTYKRRCCQIMQSPRGAMHLGGGVGGGVGRRRLYMFNSDKCWKAAIYAGLRFFCEGDVRLHVAYRMLPWQHSVCVCVGVCVCVCVVISLDGDDAPKTGRNNMRGTLVFPNSQMWRRNYGLISFWVSVHKWCFMKGCE